MCNDIPVPTCVDNDTGSDVDTPGEEGFAAGLDSERNDCITEELYFTGLSEYTAEIRGDVQAENRVAAASADGEVDGTADANLFVEHVTSFRGKPETDRSCSSGCQYGEVCGSTHIKLR